MSLSDKKDYIKGQIDGIQYCVDKLNNTPFVYQSVSGIFIKSASVYRCIEKVEYNLALIKKLQKKNNVQKVSLLKSRNLQVDTIVRTKHNIHNYPARDGYNWKYIYYKLCDGMFEVTQQDESIMKFDGVHFVCQGSDFWVDMFGVIFGLEILDREYEIVDKLPNNLKQ